MLRIFTATLLAFAITLVSTPPINAAPPKIGSSCSNPGKLFNSKSITYECKKKGKKLVWSKVSKGASSITASDPTSSCQYRSNSGSITGFGFPKHPKSLPSQGELAGLMVFVNFTDVKGTDDPLVVGSKFTKKFEDFYYAQSYGKLKIKTTIIPKYLEINKASGSYGMDTWGGGDPGKYWLDGLSAASQIEELSKYDFVVVMPPNTIQKIIYGPAFPGWSPSQFPNLKPYFSGAVGGADQRNKQDSTGWIWLSHEIGHTLGFEHQYGYYPQPIWDLMDNVYIDTAPALFGWHRFIQGWLDDNQVLCLSDPKPGLSIEVRLDPLEGNSPSTKLALIKLTPSTLLGFEYRKRLGFDKLPAEAEGVLVHTIKPTSRSNQRAIDIVKTDGLASTAGQRYGVLKSGQSLELGSHSIKVLTMDSSGATILITRK
jgi:M6 family metalloprotease-like protein